MTASHTRDTSGGMASAPALLRLLFPSSPSTTTTTTTTTITRAPARIPFYAPFPCSRICALPPQLPIYCLPRSAVQEAAGGGVEAIAGDVGQTQRQRLYVANLPWSLSASDIQSLLGQCSTVREVEIIKHKDGKSKGFAFVTVDSEEEARAVIDKFDSYELLDRIIRIEYAKSLKKPSLPPPPANKETRHLIYVSNLAWKVRSGNLREFFSASFKPASARVVFDSPSGKSAGYGFVSFATEEEALAAISELDGKELMGRALKIKMSEKKGDNPATEQEPVENSEGPADAS